MLKSRVALCWTASEVVGVNRRLTNSWTAVMISVVWMGLNRKILLQASEPLAARERSDHMSHTKVFFA